MIQIKFPVIAFSWVDNFTQHGIIDLCFFPCYSSPLMKSVILAYKLISDVILDLLPFQGNEVRVLPTLKVLLPRSSPSPAPTGMPVRLCNVRKTEGRALSILCSVQKVPEVLEAIWNESYEHPIVPPGDPPWHPAVVTVCKTGNVFDFLPDLPGIEPLMNALCNWAIFFACKIVKLLSSID